MRQFKKRMLANGLALSLVLSSLPITHVSATEKSNVKFSDVKGHWAESFINDFTNKGYINGYGDGTFRPNNKITRAEFVKLINITFGFTHKGNENFSDVNKGDWYYDEVLKAVKQGYIHGYEDGTFKPNDEITREEACKIIGVILEVSGDGKTKFKDEKEISDWAIKYVDGLVDKGIIHGYEDNTFKPQNNATRAESVKTLHGAKDKYSSDEDTPPVINPTPPSVEPEQPIDPDDELLNPDNPKWNMDSDKDGLMDAEEELIGTDPNKSDTDGDGLNDKFELESGLDATKKDSDNNNISDSEEDLDKDGLKNKDEQNHNTSAIIDDTDADGLNDYEEINKYKTNPLEEDTDKDGIIDGKEIELGTDPTKKDSNGNGINDGNEKYEVNIETPKSDKDQNVDVNISGNITGKNIDDLYIINMEDGHEFISSDIPGYVAAPFRVGTNGDSTENVDITFTLDSEVVKNNTGDEFAIYKYNKEKQSLEIVSEPKKLNYSRNSVVSMHCNVLLGIGTYYEYIVLNKTKWDEAWSKEMIDPGNESGLLDIVLTIDSSGSMTSNDPGNLRKQESIDFINKLEGENRAAVVDFDSYAKVNQDLTTDKELLIKAISKIDSSGGTNISKGLRASIDVLDSSNVAKINIDYDKYTVYDDETATDELNLEKIKDIDYIKDISKVQDIENELELSGRNKFIMLLTDGESTIDSNLIKEAKAKNIKVYTIGLGSGIDSKALENISTETGGKYQYGETAEDFEQIFKELADGTINLIQDTDGDGIPDYFEENMRLVGGIFIKLDPKIKDTDDDGVDDGEEITGKKNPTPEDFHNMYIREQRAFLYYSRPDLKDTDKDGINDNEDEEPKNVTVTPTLLLKASDLSYENTVDDVLGDVKDVKFEVRDLPNRGLEDIGEWKIIGSNDPNGFGAVVLKNGNQIIIAYTGSADISDIYNPDWKEDYIYQHLVSALFKESYQRDLAIDLLDFIVDGYGSGCNIYITGHSLGGYLAQVATYKLNYETPNGRSIFKEAMTFNTEPILNDRMLSKYKSISLDKVESLGVIGDDKLVHNYHIKNDILHKYLVKLFNRPIMGGSKRIFYSEYDSAEAHKLTNFYGKNLTFYNN